MIVLYHLVHGVLDSYLLTRNRAQIVVVILYLDDCCVEWMQESLDNTKSDAGIRILRQGITRILFNYSKLRFKLRDLF